MSRRALMFPLVMASSTVVDALNGRPLGAGVLSVQACPGREKGRLTVHEGWQRHHRRRYWRHLSGPCRAGDLGIPVNREGYPGDGTDGPQEERAHGGSPTPRFAAAQTGPGHATTCGRDGHLRRRTPGIDEVFEALDNDLVGLAPVKKKVQEIAALLLVDGARRRFGLAAPRPNMHMCFTGPPGTGKTTVALRMAELLHRLGAMISCA